MLITATYVCPIRGLAGLEPPEPERLGQAARVAKNLGLERLQLPILEESLLGPVRAKVRFLDGLIQALDRLAEGGLSAWLVAPSQQVLGMAWTPPYLVRALRDPMAPQVFVDGRLRNLWPLNWWTDPPLVQKRLKIFRELVAAVQGHPAITGWVILDRALQWARPELQSADLVLKSYLAEIRERDDSECIYLGLGLSELLDPEIARALASQVDGLRFSGFEGEPLGLARPGDPADELLEAAYLGSLAQWFFERPTEIEIGWAALGKEINPEEILEGSRRFAGQGLAGGSWLTLVDPEPVLYTSPPWILYPGLEQVGLLDRGLEPKAWVEPWIREVHSGEPKDAADDFIDVSPEDYLADPRTHLPRLWNHFREWS